MPVKEILNKKCQRQVDQLLTLPLTNRREVDVFLDGARALGPTIKPNILGKLRNKNQEVLGTLSEEYKKRQPPIEKNKIYIIIPVVEKEKEFSGILEDLCEQIELIQEHQNYRVKIIIAINGKGENTDARQAFDDFSRKHSPPKNTALNVMEIKKQGKLVAFDHVLNNLEKQETFPEKIFFFDDDARIKKLCLPAMLNLLEEVPAVGATIVYREPQNIFDEISQVQTRGHCLGKPGNDWLHGGAYALSAELIALYHAYVHAFPGTIMNDVNWVQIMRSQNISYKLTEDPYLVLSSPTTLVDLWMQQKRWFDGLKQGIGFNSSPKEAAPFPNILAWQYLKKYFPNFPKVTQENIHNFMKNMEKGEVWDLPFFSLLFMASYLNEPISIRIGGKQIPIGGPPPNPYRQKGWEPPRDYDVQKAIEIEYIPKTALGSLVAQARLDGKVTFRGIEKCVRKTTELTTIIGQGHVQHTKAQHFHESLNAYLSLVIGLSLDRIHLAPVEVADNEFEAAMEDVIGLNMQGVTVTVPLKERAYEYIQEHDGFLDEQTMKSGAVNTIVNTGHGLVGTNTDIHGFIGASKEAGVELKGIDAAIVGTGGMGRAALIGLCENGAKSVKLFDIDQKRAQKVAQEFQEMYPNVKIVATETIKQCLNNVSYVAQCSTVGMGSDQSPIPAKLIKPSMAVIDAVYVPLDTQFLLDAQAAGCKKIITGLKIVAHGGVKQIEVYTGKKIPEQFLPEILDMGEHSILTALRH